MSRPRPRHSPAGFQVFQGWVCATLPWRRLPGERATPQRLWQASPPPTEDPSPPSKPTFPRGSISCPLCKASSSLPQGERQGLRSVLLQVVRARPTLRALPAYMGTSAPGAPKVGQRDYAVQVPYRQLLAFLGLQSGRCNSGKVGRAHTTDLTLCDILGQVILRTRISHSSELKTYYVLR